MGQRLNGTGTPPLLDWNRTRTGIGPGEAERSLHLACEVIVDQSSWERLELPNAVREGRGARFAAAAAAAGGARV